MCLRYLFSKKLLNDLKMENLAFLTWVDLIAPISIRGHPAYIVTRCSFQLSSIHIGRQCVRGTDICTCRFMRLGHLTLPSSPNLKHVMVGRGSWQNKHTIFQYNEVLSQLAGKLSLAIIVVARTDRILNALQ